MFPQRRMTTDTPDGNYEQALNLFVRGEDGWVQMPSRSISLNDYMKQLIKAHNADIDTEGTPEEFDMTLCEHLFDGPETIEGLLAEHYTLSWALASLRDKLKHYEDALIPEIMPEGLQTIDRAIGTYGKDAQLTKAVEEMSELTKALCKLKECKRKYDTPFNRETQEVHSNIEEEIADVFIMLVQLFAIFNPHELVNITKVVWDKLDRLKDNLDKEAAKQEASDAGFQKILNGNHTITVEVSDGKETVSTSATFTKAVHAASVTLAEPLTVEGDITVAVLQVTGSIPDDAKFKAEVTNNAKDAAPVWQDATTEAKKGVNIVFENKTATAGAAFNFRVSVERGASGEGGYIEAVSGAFQ